MANQRRDDDVREFRFEGLGLGLVVALLLFLIGGSFFLGRWYERGKHPTLTAAGQTGSDPLANVARDARKEPLDVEQTTDFFDTVEGGEKQVEPKREARKSSSAPTSAATASTPAAVRPGDFFVQVFAGRDEGAAAGLVRKLEAEGQPVRLVTERESRGVLYKVRVGGYPTEDEARTAAKDLQAKGYQGAWVTKKDG